MILELGPSDISELDLEYTWWNGRLEIHDLLIFSLSLELLFACQSHEQIFGIGLT